MPSEKTQENALRTLKDFEETYCDAEGLTNSIDKEDLRAEAIKWIKELYNHISQYPADVLETEGKIDWIKHFFNITDEELK